ncbi:hypothetical protein TWF730_002465 [Orbilia blumenaviensis]|uniref:Uncharacterized protein n=1 Tax=Orbilia blumenaviensis TaxID=1796055 RepID=A0AAV9UE63_9PEZI
MESPCEGNALTVRMAAVTKAVLVEMPNFGSTVDTYYKVDDVESLFNAICGSCPFLEPHRMSAFRYDEQLDITDELSFGEKIIVKYKCENLDAIGPQSSRLVSRCCAKEQQNPNAGSVSIQSPSIFPSNPAPSPATLATGVRQILGKYAMNGYQEPSEREWYKPSSRVPVIRVKLPGAGKSTIIAPGQSWESHHRFRRIGKNEQVRLYLDNEKTPIIPLEYMTLEQIEKIKMDSDSNSEKALNGTNSPDSIVPDEEISQLEL